MSFPPRRFPEDVPTLADGDVVLRAHRLEDVDAVVEQCTDPHSVRWTTVPLGYDDAMARDWITSAIPQAWAGGTSHLFAVETTHPDGVRRFSGTVEVRALDGGRGEVAFGAHPAVRGTGAMRTAVELVLDHAFDTLGLRAVVWWTEVGNWGSRTLAWSTGFRVSDGVVPRYLDHRDELVDAWVGTLAPTERAQRHPAEVPVLETDRLVLRGHRRSDDVRVAEGCADPLTQHWLSHLPSPYTLADAAAFRLATRTGALDGRTWAVVERDRDLLVGTVGVHGHSDGLELGYWTHPDARGRGLTTEAVSRVVQHLLTDHPPRRLIIRAAEGNAASLAVAGACGFTRCGRTTGTARRRDGTGGDHVVLERPC
ncbi:GNAT family N-acetyltransferase [Auraticoccus monumenti]|uniref:Protein N-acetyltransferase, RimJ/RimL family n=1 Tax=Auraticoccus monumenti TaxID=675864 RepID=A0A1G6Y110_9ACTN|nr:GNAT family N-acetyltransferase [Auraticoccus monumenti]SDD83325.1 Protein N-acetyltransferase, RimJ/RimL family [Auraticoccus monumenti]